MEKAGVFSEPIDYETLKDPFEPNPIFTMDDLFGKTYSEVFKEKLKELQKKKEREKN